LISEAFRFMAEREASMATRMTTVAQLVAATTLAVAVPMCAQGQDVAGGAGERSIVVTATGVVSVSPDRAALRVGIVTRGTSAAAAAGQNAGIAGRVRDALQRLGYRRDSVPTAAYNVFPEFDQQGRDRRIVGYTAQSALEVHVADLTAVGGVIDAALGAGASGIDQLQFESSAADTARVEALARAVRSARREAEAIAHAAGGELGPMLEANTTYGGVPMMTMRTDALAARAPTEVTPGDLDVSATITVRWTFRPAP
jgi:uncharacterized protein YggE